MPGWRQKYKTWEDFFREDFRDILLGDKKSNYKELSEIVKILRIITPLKKEGEISELAKNLNDVHINYGEGFLVFRKLKRKDGELYLIDSCLWRDFY